MDFTSELLARLQGGENVEDLAKELTKAINDASAEHARLQEQKRKEAEAQRKADEKAQDKLAAMEAILDGVYGLLHAYDADEELLDAIEDLEAEHLVQELDKVWDAAVAYADLMETMYKSKSAPAPKERPVDPIEDFLREAGLRH